MTHVIDATGKTIGRVSTEAAMHLMGKTAPTYARNAVTGDDVKIINASKASITQKKGKEKVYVHYTGYPGGLRKTTLDQLVEKKGATEPFKKAVRGMLPSNKLRPIMLKKLTVED